MIKVNPDELGQDSEYSVETEVIPPKFQVCRLVSYIELGHHYTTYQGKQKVYDKGKHEGKPIDEMMIHLVFEFSNAAYTGDFPLCIKTSSPFKGDGLLNKLSVSKGIEEGWLSRKFAMKSNYMKALIAMQDATGTEYQSLAQFVGTVFGCTIKHVPGKERDDGTTPVYANMALDSIVAPEFTHPISGDTEQIPLAEQIGEYCECFDWDNPNIEAWAEVPEYLKKYIMKAVDYKGSALEALLNGYKEPESDESPAEAEGTTDDEAPATTETNEQEPIEDDIPF